MKTTAYALGIGGALVAVFLVVRSHSSGSGSATDETKNAAKSTTSPTPKATSQPLPEALPPEAYAKIKNDANPEGLVEMNYNLALHAHLSRCAEPTIPSSNYLYYWIQWKVDPDGTAHDPQFSLDDGYPQEGWSSKDLATFRTCVGMFLSSDHPLSIPVYGKVGERAWAMRTRFPISQAPIYKIIREATSSKPN